MRDDTTTPDDTSATEQRAGELTDRKNDNAHDHTGNRVSADADEPQPTREPTRDRQS